MHESNDAGPVRIKAPELRDVFYRLLLKYDFPEKPANICADVFTGNSVDGVYSHGVTRFPKFIKHIKEGHINPGKEAIFKSSTGNLEQWDGQLAPGPVNALLCTERSMTLARENGIGCVALANTNHWLRGGTYGWKAAKAGFVFIGWSNTIANMPVWGATDPKLGNNPLVIAIPYNDDAIVLDMAMSQYSYGAMEMYDLRQQPLPVPGGYDIQGNLTTIPSAIKASQRPLPIGYWKGSGLSLLLDILGAVLSGGLSTKEITAQGGEFNLSQTFITIDMRKLGNFQSINAAIENIIADYHLSMPVEKEKNVRYPGEQVIAVRAANLAHGVPVLPKVWAEIMAL